MRTRVLSLLLISIFFISTAQSEMIKTPMKFTKLFTGSDGKSHFQDAIIDLHDASIGKTSIGKLSNPIAAKQLIFGETTGVGEVSWHNPPRRQYIMMLAGIMEIETGTGAKREFGVGDILLAEDTTGQGHVTRSVGNKPCRYITIPIE